MTEIIKNIESILMFVAPGFVFRYIYRYISFKLETKELLSLTDAVTCVVYSFFINTLINFAGITFLIDKYQLSSDKKVVITLCIAALLGVISGFVSRYLNVYYKPHESVLIAYYNKFNCNNGVILRAKISLLDSNVVYFGQIGSYNKQSIVMENYEKVICDNNGCCLKHFESPGDNFFILIDWNNIKTFEFDCLPIPKS